MIGYISIKLFTIKSAYDTDDTEKTIHSKDKVNQWWPKYCARSICQYLCMRHVNVRCRRQYVFGVVRLCACASRKFVNTIFSKPLGEILPY